MVAHLVAIGQSLRAMAAARSPGRHARQVPRHGKAAQTGPLKRPSGRLARGHDGLGGRVVGLHLQSNRLTGGIPRELGGLASLQWLPLNNNALSGAAPAELGRLSGLAGLLLNNNAERAGALPPAQSPLSALELFRYDGTGLCVPGDASFRAWLDALRHRPATQPRAADGARPPPPGRSIRAARARSAPLSTSATRTGTR